MPLGGADALAILLPTESFLVGAIAVAVAVRNPHKPVARFKLPASVMPIATILVTVAVVMAAVVAWGQVYGGGTLRPLDDALIAGGLLTAALGQGFLAVWLALGMFDG